MSTVRIALAALALSALPALAQAPAGPRLDVAVDVHKEVTVPDASGKPTVRLEPVAAASPGDVLVYTLSARNTGGSPALQPRLEDPIPSGTVLLVDSVPGPGRTVSASVDGGKSWQAFPATVRRTAPDGSVQTVEAPPEVYTHLRWVLAGPLQPGASAEVRFKVKVQ